MISLRPDRLDSASARQTEAGPRPEVSSGRVRWSLAQRLQQQLLFSLALLWLISVAAAMVTVRQEMHEALDRALLTLAAHLPLGESDLAPAMPADLAQRHGWPSAPPESLHVLVRDHSGGIQRRQGLAADPAWPLDLPAGMSTVADWRVATQHSADGKTIIQVGEPLRERRQALEESTVAMVLPLLALLPLAAFAIHLLMRRVFRGMQAASEHWRARAEGDLSPPPTRDLPMEFDPLIVSIDSLIQRLREVVQAERAFASSSAHELRTPLAAARAQAQRLLAELSSSENRAHALALVRSLDRISNTTTKLLQLARVESGIGRLRERIDLRQLADLVLDEFRHLADSAGRLQVQLPDEPVMVWGDLDALGIAMRNLVENALKHAPLAQVRVRIEPPARLVVCDDGPGVAPELLDSLLVPFKRGPSPAEGSGLGLSIVAKIAGHQQASLQLESPLAGKAHGFRASLTLSSAALPPETPEGAPASS